MGLGRYIETGWWKPLPIAVRRWEQSFGADISSDSVPPLVKEDVKMGDCIELERPAGLQGKELEDEMRYESPFREEREKPRRIGEGHAWGMIKWGKRAGAWGQGPEGLAERRESERDRSK